MKKIIAIILSLIWITITLVSCDAPPKSNVDEFGEPIVTQPRTKYEPINIPKTNYTTPFMAQVSTAKIPPQPTTATNLTPYQQNVSTYEHGSGGDPRLKTEKTTKSNLYNPVGTAIHLKDVQSALLSSSFYRDYNRKETQKCFVSLNGNQLNISYIKYERKANSYDPTAESILTPTRRSYFSISYSSNGSLMCNINEKEIKTAGDVAFINNIITTLFNEIYKLYKYPNGKGFSSDWFKSNKKYSIKENGFTFTTKNSKFGPYVNSFEISLIYGLYL